MNENLAINNPIERLEKMTCEFMQFYSDISAEQQVQLFSMIKESVIKHRNGMINDCKSDLEATEHRLKCLYDGLGALQQDHDASSLKPNM